ncbi:MAG TPA: hypothetical protein VN939_06755, partial [Chthoniobacterales bacterium]|nr:hypothetical protein [Chthoniobacterales bacterium]
MSAGLVPKTIPIVFVIVLVLERFAHGLNTPRIERTKRLEGSQTSPHRYNSGRLRRAGRFTRWQLYRFASRRLPGTSRGVAALWARLDPPHGIHAMGKTLRWV